MSILFVTERTGAKYDGNFVPKFVFLVFLAFSDAQNIRFMNGVDLMGGIAALQKFQIYQRIMGARSPAGMRSRLRTNVPMYFPDSYCAWQKGHRKREQTYQAIRVRGRKTKVRRKLLRFPSTRFIKNDIAESTTKKFVIFANEC